MVLDALFHAWERRLAAATKDRVVRPFEWGLDWIPPNGAAANGSAPRALAEFAAGAVADSDAFFAAAPTSDYVFRPTDEGGVVTFPSAFATPHEKNNRVSCRYFRARQKGSPEGRSETTLTAGASLSGERGPAVLVLPQWNANRDGHVGLCRVLAWNGLHALRLTLPYHDDRMPPELHRADYIVSANVGRTLQVCRQAVLDARRAIAWLAARGHAPIGILGTSLGSCLALLTTAHEPLVRAQALNHISPYFADVVWRGLSTRHVREGLDGAIDLDELRRLWAPISPQSYLDRLAPRDTLLVYARYDLSFPVDLSESLVHAFAARGIPHEVARLRCGHYSSGKAPFKYVDGWVLTRFLKRALTLG
jgi:dienelactone hydrolase